MKTLYREKNTLRRQQKVLHGKRHYTRTAAGQGGEPGQPAQEVTRRGKDTRIVPTMF